MKQNNKPKYLRGQIQLGETIAVVFIVMILLVIGMVFWNKVSNSNIRNIQSQSQELSVIEIANNVPELAELKCYEASVNQVKCLDWYKIVAMSNAMKNTSDRSAFILYNNYFKNSKITIVKMYPTTSGEVENITLYDSKIGNNTNSTTTLLIPVPIHIKDYVNHQTFYGMIIVEGYYVG